MKTETKPPVLNASVCTQQVKKSPIRMIQFGEGVFLRGFVDWMVEKLRQKDLFNGAIAVVQPIEMGRLDMLEAQNGLYTLRLRGIQDGEFQDEETLITALQAFMNPYTDFDAYLALAEQIDTKYIVSNTTEAGISWMDGCKLEDKPAQSYPAKLTQLLYHRYKHFDGSAESGMRIMPCELIDRNGDNLRRLVLRHAEVWQLPNTFIQWLNNSCYFYNTLVDRIVTGYPADEVQDAANRLGYTDHLYNTAEYFHLWVIEGPEDAGLPFAQAGLNVVWTDDLTRYRERKVRILNGAHTLTFAAALLSGIETVRETLEDETLKVFMQQSLDQAVIPYVPIETSQVKKYADRVLERFMNPNLQHQWLSIALNAVSKFKVRVLPSLLDGVKAGNRVSPHLCFSLAALILLYRGDKVKPQDDDAVCQFFSEAWQSLVSNEDLTSLTNLTHKILSEKTLWDEDLAAVPGLCEAVAGYLLAQINQGTRQAIKALTSQLT